MRKKHKLLVYDKIKKRILIYPNNKLWTTLIKELEEDNKTNVKFTPKTMLYLMEKYTNMGYKVYNIKNSIDSVENTENNDLICYFLEHPEFTHTELYKHNYDIDYVSFKNRINGEVCDFSIARNGAIWFNIIADEKMNIILEDLVKTLENDNL